MRLQARLAFRQMSDQFNIMSDASQELKKSSGQGKMIDPLDDFYTMKDLLAGEGNYLVMYVLDIYILHAFEFLLACYHNIHFLLMKSPYTFYSLLLVSVLTGLRFGIL